MKIDLSAVAPRILESRGTPSKFVLYALKDMYAKFGAFTRFVTIFVNFDANGLDYKHLQHPFVHLGPVVQRADNSIHQINHYPVDSILCFVIIYLLDSNLSGG